ncbi:Protein pam68 [Ranunculus cassubicifolius]
MESYHFSRTLNFTLPSSLSRNRVIPQFWITHPRFCNNKILQISAALNSPRGFGKSPKKGSQMVMKKKKPLKELKNEQQDDEEEEDDEDEKGVIPEIVTNRMMNRMGLSVGIPLFVGILFFPFFYYLKVGLKIDVPTWVPFIVSFIFFGSALLGVTYGIVSTSWDPMREGSLLGWNEAKKNWPVFLKSLRGGSGKN